LGELGLKPWEYDDMTPDEYDKYAHGYFYREQLSHVPFRRLYQLLYNVNSKTKISTAGSLAAHWPLPLVDKVSGVIKTPEDMRATWERVNEKKRLRDAHAEARNRHKQ